MILLSFDTEEFDVPREHGVDFPLDKAMEVSVYGTNKILDCLKKNGVRATFFCTSNFAENAPEVTPPRSISTMPSVMPSATSSAVWRASKGHI